MATGANSDFLPDREFSSGQGSVRLAVCIPAHNEDSLLPVLSSLAQCVPVHSVKVFIVINAAEDADAITKDTNLKAFDEILAEIHNKTWHLDIWCGLYNNLPSKKAGVGLARKICMDRACIDLQPDGLLLCLDADCNVDSNYLVSVDGWFRKNPQSAAASVYFQHQIPPDTVLKSGIEKYELHLRYMKQALKWAGHPWYYHTVGSSMAVRKADYLAAGGMNTRKAGEDFYFLHKFMPRGFGEISDTVVYPQARVSDRVPFGTGRALMQITEGRDIRTYAIDSFKQLRTMYQNIRNSGGIKQNDWDKGLLPEIAAFFNEQGIKEAWDESVANTSNPDKALQRFYLWFSGFRIIRYLNDMKAVFPDEEVQNSAKHLANLLGFQPSTAELPDFFRRLDKGEILL